MKVKVNQLNQEIPQWMLDRLEGSKLLASLLIKRGIETKEAVEEFLNPNYYQPTKVTEFPRLKEAVQLILKAVDNGKKICVYGDYDADGVTATAILVRMLEEIKANVSYHIPDRFTEGYGMKQEVIKELATSGVDLIITCDCGISNQAEIALAKELGLEVIVTDHHDLPEELPAADLLLSPKFLPVDHQAYYLPGAGMAYFLAQGVLAKVKKDDLTDQLLDLVALAIVADVVPLRGENRYLLQQGLESLATTNWLGLEELCKVAGVNTSQISEVDLGFRLGPRINAAGRIDKADVAVELLLSSKPKEAAKLARQLDQINTKRKELGAKIEEEALNLVQDKSEPIILYQEDWHQGIVGIAAGRLTEKFQVPVLLLCAKKGKPEEVTGSARSIPGVHIRDALLECKDFLLGFGGHAGAAGCSLQKDNLAEFTNKLKDVLTAKLKEAGGFEEIEVDQRLKLDKTGLELYEQLRSLAPFGEGNPEPLFYAPNLELLNYRPLGSQKHLKLVVSDGQEQRSAIWWQAEEDKLADKVALVYSLDVNNWQGKRRFQLEVKEVISATGQIKEDKQIDCEFEDRRGWQELGRELPSYSRAVYYYEGTKKWDFKVVDRYYQQPADTLVLLSCPPDLTILQDLLYSIDPNKLVLAYSKAELELSAVFIKKLVGLVKYIIENKDGKIDIYTLSSLTGEQELTLSLGLKYLQELGKISLQFINPYNILITRGTGEKNYGANKKRLYKLLRESRAFREYMLESNIEKINYLVTG
ncbi:single-stranded-DNA-specific exonuclease RecJ [Halobacteroides halobius DSM 5150]|uniref:Single-stranded-DNA-specific exonuclease RecJ n=1 Tax=Halobacteroides halobius (strain ATCC 35273 / DSM 5150 / MD-1) TaxID=748449 RepID=L0KAD2_HALHC|nr:single-stranded-DNA-specific exonuclease RecJ [Halobacteroides halobius]AGB41500.1 single-stranded-DNA-specific exonuclease RecJ [Halobacteroides halobius DSM 5150]